MSIKVFKNKLAQSYVIFLMNPSFFHVIKIETMVENQTIFFNICTHFMIKIVDEYISPLGLHRYAVVVISLRLQRSGSGAIIPKIFTK